MRQIEHLIEDNNGLAENLIKTEAQLRKAMDLIGKIDGALPCGLESFLNQDELNHYYETGTFK